MNKPTLATTVLSFAFSGMLPAHRREYGYEAPRSVSLAGAAAKKK